MILVHLEDSSQRNIYFLLNIILTYPYVFELLKSNVDFKRPLGIKLLWAFF